MAATTTRLALRKPAGTDLVNVSTDLDANYDLIDAVVGFTNCTSTTRPSTPFTGQGIRESDTGAALVSNGSSPASASWSYLVGTGGFTTVGATGPTAAVRIQTTSSISGNRAFDFRKQADANASYICDFDGKMQWGPGGSGAPDVNLYRSATSTLKTDQNLVVAGNMTVSGNIAVTGNGSIRVVSGSVAATAGNLVVTSGTTESNISNLAQPASGSMTVTAGRYYKLCLQVEANGSVANDEYAFQVRYGTALTGTMIAQFRWQVANVTAFSDTKSFAIPWPCATSDAGAKFFVSVVRLAGSGALSVAGNGRSAFWIEDTGGDTNVWRTS